MFVYVMAVLLVTYPRAGNYMTWCRSLVERKLAACVNVVELKSFYRWEGRVHEDDEVLLIMKTSTAAVQALKETVAREHPYKVPSIVELSPVDVNKPYLEWVLESTQA